MIRLFYRLCGTGTGGNGTGGRTTVIAWQLRIYAKNNQKGLNPDPLNLRYGAEAAPGPLSRVAQGSLF